MAPFGWLLIYEVVMVAGSKILFTTGVTGTMMIRILQNPSEMGSLGIFREGTGSKPHVLKWIGKDRRKDRNEKESKTKTA